MNEVKNILLIGRTGRGKSSLANVLLNKNGKFEEIFKEGAGSVSQTRKIQSEEFDVEPSKEKKIDSLFDKIVSRKKFDDKELLKRFLDKLKFLFEKLKEKFSKNKSSELEDLVND